MGLKELTADQLKAMQDVIALFEFYGVSEAQIRELPQLFKDIATIKDILNTIIVQRENDRKTKEANKIPSSQELHEVFKASEDLRDE